jgi:hypothetical protein
MARAQRDELDLIDDFPWPLPAGYEEPAFQDRLKRAAVACRAALDRAVAEFGAVDPAAADPGPLLAVFDDLERRCRGTWDLLGTLLRVGDAKWATTQELWFAVGRAGIAAGREELVARIGRRLVDQGADPFADPLPKGLPPRRARGLHLLALAMPGAEGEEYARQAVEAYRGADYAPPADLLECESGTSGGRGGSAAKAGEVASGQIAVRELAVLLGEAGETDRNGDPIDHSAVRSRLRRPSSAPAEYAELAKLRDPETGRYPRRAALEVVRRIAERNREDREAMIRTRKEIRSIPPAIVGPGHGRPGSDADED